MAFEEGDITLLRRDAVQELGQDDLVEEPEVRNPPAVPGRVSGAPPKPVPAKVDGARRARDWVEECEQELRDQPDVRRAAWLYF
jgi:hypothetical protein